MIAAALPFLRPLARVLTLGVTLPVWLLLAAGGWLWLDRGSAVRQALDRAVTELVAGAEIEAANARADALALINADLKGRASALDLANRRFSDSLEAAQLNLETANEQIAALLATPVNEHCAVDDPLYRGLSGR